VGQAGRRPAGRTGRPGEPDPVGEDAYDRLRAEYRALLHEEMAGLEDEELRTLASAVQILDRLIDRIMDAEAAAVAPAGPSSA